ncbi:MAG TPA: hypothetical protein VJ729_13050 [Nitrososphaeraceae archaeon]|nr:hypothetical protein [Nitrososphaeraceae archaeon]
MLFGNKSARKMAYSTGKNMLAGIENQPWFLDLQKLSNDELTRMYNLITTDGYEFAKNAWYIPLSGDKRCPIMVAKGYEAPQSPEKMIEFEDTAKILEKDYQRFIDAWDFGYITKIIVEKAILGILEQRSIAIIEHTP